MSEVPLFVLPREEKTEGKTRVDLQLLTVGAEGISSLW